MIRSMTGFGRCESETTDYKIAVEARCLNSKQLDLGLRLPSSMRSIEQDIRTLSQEIVSRGKLDVSIHLQGLSSASTSVIDKDKFEAYLKQLTELSLKHGLKSDLLPIVLRMPEVLKQEEELSLDGILPEILLQVKECLLELDKHRLQEGDVLEKDMNANCEAIASAISIIEPLEEERKEALRSKLVQAAEALSIDLDPTRFQQEMIYYLEKWDINEEKVRLKSHLNFFKEEMDKGNKQGRKLHFISQEMGREINTIGSKCNHSEIQKQVVRMKDHLEQIKEQLGNIL
jgi:uncharacterized protein (TIGR00255 family)